MKRLLMLGTMALVLSGCVSDDPGYGSGYGSRYGDGPRVYEQRSGRVYLDDDRRGPLYRSDRYDDRRSYREPYRAPYRDDRRVDQRDDDRRNSGRADRYVRPQRDDRPVGAGPERGGPDRAGPERRPNSSFRPRIVTGQIEGAPAGSTCQQGVFNDCSAN